MQKEIENLKVWKESMSLAVKLYDLTRNFPESERYGLTQQIRRSAVSVPTNISEGKGRDHRKEYLQFLHISKGSLYELMTLVYLAKELNYLRATEAESLQMRFNELAAMLRGLIQSLR